jgi:hypothetical protein
MFVIVSILTGVAIIAGLLGSFYPGRQAQAQILTSPRALLGSAEIVDVLNIGALDDVLGVRLPAIRAVLEDEAALRDLLIARITRLLVLRAALRGDLTAVDLDEIIDFVQRLELASTFRLLMIHRILQLQLARFTFLDNVGPGLDDVLLFRGFGFAHLLVFEEFELEDIDEEFTEELRLFRFGFQDDDDFNAGLHFRLNDAFARRRIAIDDLDNRILPEKRFILAGEVGEREERVLRRPRILGPERERLALQREFGLRQRLQELDAERQLAPRAPAARPAAPRVAPRVPADEEPAPRVAPRAPADRPAAPRVAPRVPADEEPAPRVAPRAPADRPAAPRVAPRAPADEEPAPRVAPRAPADRPAAPRVAPRAPAPETPVPRIAPRVPPNEPQAPRVAPRAPAARPPAPRVAPRPAAPRIAPRAPAQRPR